MICPECHGKWVIKAIEGHRRQVCSKCGCLNTGQIWVNEEYVGDPKENPITIQKHIEYEAGLDVETLI